MKKIIIIGPAYPYRGSLSELNEKIAAEYVRRGDEVMVFTFTLQYPAILFPGKTQYSTDAQSFDLNIVRNINSINPYNWVYVGDKIGKLHPDFVVFSYWMPFFAPCFAIMAKRIHKHGNIRVVGLVHNFISHESSLFDRLLTPCFVKAMDGFITLSEYVCNQVHDFVKDEKPVLVAPVPSENSFGEKVSKTTALKKLNLDENFNYLLFFGFIRHYKGLDMLIDTLADIRLQKYHVKLLVAGEFYEDKQQYIDRINRLQLSERIIIIDKFIANDDIKYYFSAVDALVLPYRSATQSGLTEKAYNYDTPMIATNVGALSESVIDGKVGYVVDPNVEAITNGLLQFYEEAKYEYFVENIKIEKHKRTWLNFNNTINEVVSLIDNHDNTK